MEAGERCWRFDDFGAKRTVPRFILETTIESPCHSAPLKAYQTARAERSLLIGEPLVFPEREEMKEARRGEEEGIESMEKNAQSKHVLWPGIIHHLVIFYEQNRYSILF